MQGTSEHESRAGQPVAVLFAQLGEWPQEGPGLPPAELAHMRRRCFERIAAGVHYNGGQVVRRTDRRVMALFGLRQPAGVAAADVVAAAVNAGLDLNQSLSEYGRSLSARVGQTIQVRGGGHSGTALATRVARGVRLSGLAETARIASRIARAGQSAPAGLLLSAQSHALIADRFVNGRRFAFSAANAASEPLLEITASRRLSASSDARIARVGRELADLVTRESAPRYLRLVFHDAASTGQKGGGLNGSVRFELDRLDNQPLGQNVHDLIDLQQRLAAENLSVSFADLLAGSGIAAVSVCGGPEIPLELGRADVETAVPPGFLPENNDRLPRLRERFEAMGLGLRELVALSGGHTLGHSSGLAFTEDPYQFNNSYFRRLVGESAEGQDEPGSGLTLLPTDRTLLEDSESLALIREYARNEARFFEDFAAAYLSLVRGSL